MTTSKKLKKEIRTRASRTGESYTAARRQVLLARGKPAPASIPKPELKPAIGNESIVKATGHGYDHWFGVLDAFDAPAKGHTASAAHLLKEHGIRAWYAQMITVQYERARGKRSRNQSCSGDFQVNVSKAMGAGIEAVTAALSDGRWLKDADPELSRAFPRPARLEVKNAKLAKLRYKWDGTTIEIRVTATKSGATVTADNMKLSDAAHVERRRSQWRTALEALRAFLAK